MKILNFKALLKGILLSMAVSIVALVILSVFVFFMDISDNTVSVLVFAITAVSVLAGAFVLAKNIECGGLVNGLALAVGYFLVLLVVSLAIEGGVSFSVQNIIRLLIALAAGMLGGVLGINN